MPPILRYEYEEGLQIHLVYPAFAFTTSGGLVMPRAWSHAVVVHYVGGERIAEQRTRFDPMRLVDAEGRCWQWDGTFDVGYLGQDMDYALVSSQIGMGGALAHYKCYYDMQYIGPEINIAAK